MKKRKLPWLEMRRKTDPELPLKGPLWFGNQSNGEYFKPATARDRKVERLVLQRADENARRVGMDRRTFLASAMGMCTTLAVLNEAACSSETTGDSNGNGGGSGGTGGGAGSDSGADARFCAIPETQYDEEMACAALNGLPDEFIFDVQTHWFDPTTAQPSYVNLFRSLFTNGTEDNYVRYMFCESQTTVAAITSWPGNPCGPGVEEDQCGLPLSNTSMADSRDRMNQRAANTRRSVNHVQVMGQSALGIESELATMEEMCGRSGTAAWKLYPGFLSGFRMDGEIGRKIIEKGIELGVNQFCIHKGLQIIGFNIETNYPDDIGVIAADYPEAKFVIYHSAITAGYDTNATAAPQEGPYDPGPGAIGRPFGTNALIKALADRGIGPEPGQTPNRNVYGEIGSAINQVMNDPTATAHFFGKLMKYLGPDYVVWGTDCIVYGSPQPFIDWFRNVQIPQSMQEQYGYPPLDNTPAGRVNRAKIFGLNAARLYGLDVEETRCGVATCPTALLKQRLDEELGARRWVFDEPLGPRTYADYLLHIQRAAAEGRPG
jgi:uncharacterized protein